MTTFYLAVAVVLLASLCGGMYRVLRGPTPGDRMLAGQLFGTAAVAVLLLVDRASDTSVLVDVALVFALLAAVTVVAFVRRAWRESEDDGPRA
ncbi:MAG: multiple resistance and pH regulation protein F [Chromatiales bacterium]|nr:MAG: multiple resistance and pH regulation protein F [Chromatiales bacterium]